nr:T9SS type A sorting domain-containing protein [Hymenobacter ruricola]
MAARPTAAPNISLAPNPAHDDFTVQLPANSGSTKAALLNALGQVVRRPAVSGAGFRVETAGLAPGVYSLRLHSGAGPVAKRVVVE